MTPINDFLDGEKLIAGISFRPFTIGSKALCEQLKLTMFVTGEGGETPGEAERQIAAFTWIHVAPLAVVLKAVREGKAEDAALEYAFSIPTSSLNAIVAEINRISEQAKANAVEVDSTENTKTTKPGN
jgi:hypothetical protein